MNQQNQANPPKVFAAIDGNSLMAQEYEPLQFATRYFHNNIMAKIYQVKLY